MGFFPLWFFLELYIISSINYNETNFINIQCEIIITTIFNTLRICRMVIWKRNQLPFSSNLKFQDCLHLYSYEHKWYFILSSWLIYIKILWRYKSWLHWLMLFLFADKNETMMPTTSTKELHLNDAFFT